MSKSKPIPFSDSDDQEWTDIPLTSNQRLFLNAYAECGVIAEAARISGLSAQNHHLNWKHKPDYRRAFKLAHEAATDLLEAEARRRGLEGWEQPVIWNGQIQFYWSHPETGEPCDPADVPGAKKKMLTIRHKSEKLLLAVLAGNRRQKYQSRVVAHTGRVIHKIEDATKLQEQEAFLTWLESLPVDRLQSLLGAFEEEQRIKAALPAPTEPQDTP